MAANQFYPSIRDLISPSNLPDNLGFVQSTINSLFDKLFYKELKIVRGKHGEKGTYSLDIITYDDIGFGIPGNLIHHRLEMALYFPSLSVTSLEY
jgi:hypothetical protein